MLKYFMLKDTTGFGADVVYRTDNQGRVISMFATEEEYLEWVAEGNEPEVIDG